MKDLEQCRKELDEIDTQILQLLKQRIDVAGDVALYKLINNKKVVDTKREQSKLHSLEQQGRELKLSASFISDVFKSIMAHTVSYELRYIAEKVNEKSLERDVSIAHLGTVGTYSHLAATRYIDAYKGKVELMSCNSFDEIVAAVESGKCDYGMLPIENSSSGSINEVLDVLQGSCTQIIGELFYPIDHSILGCDKIKLSEITDVYSHPQPVQQCSRWLKDFLPHVKIHYMESSSHAIHAVAKLRNKTHVAIASHNAAAFYNLLPLMDNIANNNHNYTRFIYVSMTPVAVSESVQAKTSLSFTVAKYTPGSLIKVLDAFSKHNLNIVKLISRPRLAAGHDTWEEIFFADIQANIASPIMTQILDDIRTYTSSLKVLGCYPSQDHA